MMHRQALTDRAGRSRPAEYLVPIPHMPVDVHNGLVESQSWEEVAACSTP
jgi:hypothetical protein